MSDLKKGDLIDGRYEIVSDGPIAIMGVKGCEDPRCTRLKGKCIGYHCPICGKPCSMMGHPKCQEAA